MVKALMQGQIEEAFWYNPVAFLLCTITIALALLYLYQRHQHKHGRPTYATKLLAWCTSGTATIFLIILLCLWGIVRNAVGI